MSTRAAGVDTLLTSDEFREKCARHKNAQTTRSRAAFYLCTGCARRLKSEALNDRAPVYVGPPFRGSCEMCNKPKEVRLVQWYVCPRCRPVIDGYAKTEVASRFVRRFWKDEIQAKAPELILTETEPVRWEAFESTKSSQRAKSESVGVLDFAVSHRSKPQAVLFHIEMKAGPGAIDSMKEFQLDLNDSNDIARVCNKTGKPAYLVHVQIVEQQDGPTRRIIPKDLWWTDCFILNEKFKTSRQRYGEDKQAGYYDLSAFKGKKEFLAELTSANYKALTKRLVKSPLPIRPNEAMPKSEKLLRMFKRLGADEKRSFMIGLKAAYKELWDECSVKGPLKKSRHLQQERIANNVGWPRHAYTGT